MIHILLALLGAMLIAITLPLVCELALVTAANLLPDRGPIRERSAVLVSDPANPAPKVRLAVIVPAHNEDLLVAQSVKSLRAAATDSTTILVVAHNCTDKTAQNARDAGAEVLVYDDAAAKGKGFALRYGFQYALDHGADAVMVVDSDSTVTPNTVHTVTAAIAAGAQVVQCRYEMVSTTAKSSTRLSALAFRAFNVIRPRGRERLGLSAGIVGNGFAIVRPVLERVPYDAFSVVEDLEYHLHLVLAGQRVRYIDSAMVSADFPESRAGESVQRSRWEGGRLNAARNLAGSLLLNILRGRLRLIEPLCDLTSLPIAFGAFALLVALCLPLAWLRWYAATSLAVLLWHVLTAAWAGPDFLETLKLLALTPLYILRKLWMIPGVIRGSSNKADWVRTERNNTL